jgi:hypothetical protein
METDPFEPSNPPWPREGYHLPLDLHFRHIGLDQ